MHEYVIVVENTWYPLPFGGEWLAHPDDIELAAESNGEVYPLPFGGEWLAHIKAEAMIISELPEYPLPFGGEWLAHCKGMKKPFTSEGKVSIAFRR